MLNGEEEKLLEEMKKEGKVEIHVKSSLVHGLILAGQFYKKAQEQPMVITQGAYSTLPRLSNVEKVIIVEHNPRDFRLSDKHFLNNILVIQKRA